MYPSREVTSFKQYLLTSIDKVTCCFLYFCPFLDQQLNLCRQIPDFPHIGQIPGFSESRVIFKITRFFKITTPGFFKIPNFSHIWTNPGLFSKSHVFHLDDVNGQISNSAWTNLEFCMDKSRILHGQIPNSAWTNPKFYMDKSLILHGQIPKFAWTNPRFCTLWGIPCYFKTSVFLKNSPFKVHFTIPYKNSVLFLKFPF